MGQFCLLNRTVLFSGVSMEDRPSILLLMGDQLNAGVLGCYGGPVPTPNIDRIAAQGVVFSEASCPTPFCSPSRASLITGLYPHAHGIVCNINRRDYPAIGAPPTEEGIRATDVTTEKLLNAAGYDTHHFGKWHLMDEDLPYYPDMFGEHHEYAELMRSTFERVRERPEDEWLEWYGWALPTERPGPFEKAVRALGDAWEGHPHAEFITKMGRLELPVEQVFDVLVADRTCECLRDAGPEPLMVTASFNYPHDPNVVPSPYYGMFPPEGIRLPANFETREPRFEGEWSRRIVADLGEVAAREFLRIYYASVKLVDDQVGRILQALEATGRADDTIIVFTADHGDMAGGHGMVWKSTSSFYEEVVRVPLIIRYPGQIKPQHTDLPACLTDVMPTLLDLAGHPIADHVQGRSLAPFLLDDRDPDERPRYTFSERIAPNPQHTRTVAADAQGAFMIRGDGWKYFRYPTGEEYVYDLVGDPLETRNLADDPSCDVRKAELRRALQRWLDETGYPGARPQSASS